MEICHHSYHDNDIAHLSSVQIQKDLNILIQDSQDRSLKDCLKIYGWSKVGQFKQSIREKEIYSLKQMGEIRLFHKNIELQNDEMTLSDYGIKNGSIIILDAKKNIEVGSRGAIKQYKLFDETDEKVEKLIKESRDSIESGGSPTLTKQGTSGAYILQKNGKCVSIFKPFDEQINAPNNPRGHLAPLGSEGYFKNILSGECATREVAAYLLDKNSYHGVPATTYVQFSHPTFVHKEMNEKGINLLSEENNLATKHGSLQQFAQSKGFIGDYGSKKFSVEAIHRIAILDVRILNCDRNEENILIQQNNGKYKLVPIDHGMSLPDNLQISESSIIWMSFPQAKIPFSESELKFIEEIDPIKDAEMLASKLGFRKICLRNFRAAQIFLKKAASIGFTLYEIGKILYQAEQDQQMPTKKKRSILESVIMQAETLYLNALQSIQKQNMSPNFSSSEQEQFDEESDSQIQSINDSNKESSTFGSTSTCGSVKSMLALKKKVSLPQLRKKSTSYHESRNKARKQREGFNGIGRTIWNKYHQQQWNQIFYYYFGNLIDTLLEEKRIQKNRKLPLRSQSA